MRRPPAPPVRVLFLCTRNSARSQIAEALLAHKADARCVVASAGPMPAMRVDPRAVVALAERGIDWSAARPKGLDAVAGIEWDLIITTCDRLTKRCPAFRGRPTYAHWGVPDPVMGATSDGGTDAFRDTVRLLAWRIDLMLALPPESLEGPTAGAPLGLIGREQPAPPGAAPTVGSPSPS